MKNIYTSIFILFTTCLFAQPIINIGITGTIKSVDEIPLEGVLVSAIADDLEGNYYTTFTDSVGRYDFFIESALAYGCAHVSFMDCNFLIQEEPICWEEEPSEFELDFVYCVDGTQDSICFVDFYEEQLPNNEHRIVALPSGAAPFNFYWDNGAIGSNIVVTDEGTYCVTMTAGDGCETFGCYDIFLPSPCMSYIYQDPQFADVILGVDSDGEPPFNYLWSTGETDVNIVVETTGEYCVTVEDATGCIDVTCDFVEIYVDSMGCFSWIYEDIDPMGNTLLTAEAFGFEPFTYLWDNGATTPTISLIDSLDVYCVSIVDAVGCVSESCYQILGDCGVEISCDPVPDGIWLFSNAWGEWPLTYLWSTGETTETIQIFDEGEYCLTITDANGCTSDNCFMADPGNNPFDSNCVVFIFEEFNPDGIELFVETFGRPVLEYQWSTGESTPSIVVTDEGQYCLEVVYENGCVAGDCWDVMIVPNCGVNVSSNLQVDGMQFSAFPWGQEPFNFEWSTGETTPAIIVTDAGEYCLTVVDGAGCESSFCDFYDPMVFQDSCGVLIEQYYDSLYVELTAQGFGVAPFTYQWSTGELFQIIEVEYGGTYCVTITDANGCEAGECIAINTSPDFNSGGPENGIQGFVFSDGAPLEALVYLYEMQDDGSALKVDSTDLSDILDIGIMGYQFFDLPEGKYLVNAVPFGQANDGLFMPTYHQSSILWEDADLINLNPEELVTADIFMQSATGLTGPGIINGNVTEEGLWNPDNTSGSRNESPAIGVNVLLFNENNAPISFATTDANGSFRFTDLPYGRYKLMTEETGEDHFVEWVVISESDPIVNVQIDLFEIVSSSDEIISAKVLGVFPNPCVDFLTIEFNAEVLSKSKIEVVNVIGQKIETRNITHHWFNQKETIDVSNYKAGQYFIKITGEEINMVEPFVKI